MLQLRKSNFYLRPLIKILMILLILLNTHLQIYLLRKVISWILGKNRLLKSINPKAKLISRLNPPLTNSYQRWFQHWQNNIIKTLWYRLRSQQNFQNRQLLKSLLPIYLNKIEVLWASLLSLTPQHTVLPVLNIGIVPWMVIRHTIALVNMDWQLDEILTFVFELYKLLLI